MGIRVIRFRVQGLGLRASQTCIRTKLPDRHYTLTVPELIDLPVLLVLAIVI